MAKKAMKGSMKSAGEKHMPPWMEKEEEHEKQMPMRPKGMPMKMKKGMM